MTKDKTLKIANDIAIGVDVTKDGTHVIAMRLRPDGVNVVMYSQFHPLAQPEQEPWPDEPVGHIARGVRPTQRKPLTDEEIDELSRSMVKGDKSVNWLCRAIEAAHGIKENT